MLAAILSFMAASGLAKAAERVARVEVELHEGSQGMMTISLSATEVEAGKVEFSITNRSRVLPHGFLIVARPVGREALPYDSENERVKEQDLQGLQGIENIAPGQTLTLTVTLVPGDYVTFCNQPGHYDAGMVEHLTAR